MHITELGRITGASVDELRYMERKGFVSPSWTRLRQREVRTYQKEDIRKVQLILKFRKLGFTWDTASQKALQELENPTFLYADQHLLLPNTSNEGARRQEVTHG
ncbi:MerR family transcriptional regulator [Chloroflexota bacterium]